MTLFLYLFFFCTIDTVHSYIIHSFINIRCGSSPYLHSCGLSGRNLQSFTAGVTGRNLNFCNRVNIKKTTMVQSSASLLHGRFFSTVPVLNGNVIFWLLTKDLAS
jgi:hypothetical protein